MRNKLSVIMTAAVLAVGASAASAASVVQEWTATSAVGSGSDHSLWISTGLGNGVGKDFDFVPGGAFRMFDDGTGTLTGNVESQNNAGSGFAVSFDYDSDFSGNTVTNPVFKSENGSVETADTFYMDMEGGSLTGFGLLAGLNLNVSRMPADGRFATQIGSGTATENGANNKNNEFGLANWFFITIDGTPTCAICSNNSVLASLSSKFGGVQGDINLNLTPSPVPLPASGLLLLAAAGGLTGLRRRKSKA
jgi:opacity protein-like surface antigen